MRRASLEMPLRPCARLSVDHSPDDKGHVVRKKRAFIVFLFVFYKIITSSLKPPAESETFRINSLIYHKKRKATGTKIKVRPQYKLFFLLKHALNFDMSQSHFYL